MFKNTKQKRWLFFARHSLELEKIDRDILMIETKSRRTKKKDLEHDWHINRIWVVILISLGFIFSIILQLFYYNNMFDWITKELVGQLGNSVWFFAIIVLLWKYITDKEKTYEEIKTKRTNNIWLNQVIQAIKDIQESNMSALDRLFDRIDANHKELIDSISEHDQKAQTMKDLAIYFLKDPKS